MASISVPTAWTGGSWGGGGGPHWAWGLIPRGSFPSASLPPSPPTPPPPPFPPPTPLPRPASFKARETAPLPDPKEPYWGDVHAGQRQSHSQANDCLERKGLGWGWAWIAGLALGGSDRPQDEPWEEQLAGLCQVSEGRPVSLRLTSGARSPGAADTEASQEAGCALRTAKVSLHGGAAPPLSSPRWQ